MKRYFKRDINSLEKIFNYINDFAIKSKLDGKILYTLNLASEEIFTNMIKYNSNNQNDVLIDLTKDDKKIIIAFTDFDVEPFDINKVKEYDTNLSLEERPIGKVGINLIRKMVDKIVYDYQDRNSRITLVKYVENTYV